MFYAIKPLPLKKKSFPTCLCLLGTVKTLFSSALSDLKRKKKLMPVNSRLLGSYWSVLCWVCVLSPLINLNKSIYSIYRYILYILCLIKRLWKSVLACSNNCFIYYYLCTIEKVLGSIKLWFESVWSVYHTLWCIKSCFHIKKDCLYRSYIWL